MAKNRYFPNKQKDRVTLLNHFSKNIARCAGNGPEPVYLHFQNVPERRQNVIECTLYVIMCCYNVIARTMPVIMRWNNVIMGTMYVIMCCCNVIMSTMYVIMCCYNVMRRCNNVLFYWYNVFELFHTLPTLQYKKGAAEGINVYIDRHDGNGFSTTPLRDTKPPFTDTTPVPADKDAVKWTYKAIYVIDDEEVGQMSQHVSITLTVT